MAVSCSFRRRRLARHRLARRRLLRLCSLFRPRQGRRTRLALALQLSARRVRALGCDRLLHRPRGKARRRVRSHGVPERRRRSRSGRSLRAACGLRAALRLAGRAEQMHSNATSRWFQPAQAQSAAQQRHVSALGLRARCAAQRRTAACAAPQSTRARSTRRPRSRRARAQPLRSSASAQARHETGRGASVVCCLRCTRALHHRFLLQTTSDDTCAMRVKLKLRPSRCVTPLPPPQRSRRSWPASCAGTGRARRSSAAAT